ncbi:MATE family efflux transporter [alpha proteobacterium AAP81b]|nr:MATE family efflux transporter [alpha proteobacterium AAP81b]
MRNDQSPAGSRPNGNPLLDGPILPKLLRLALPNMGAMLAGSLAAVAETAYVGSLGVPALAGMAIVFPTIMLQNMLSGGAMGGGVSSAVARALGAGDRDRADALAVHSFWLALGIGITVTMVMLAAGPALFALLGGRDAALEAAIAFASVAFLGATGIWLVNLLAAVLRGAGDMAVPSSTLLATAALQIAVGGGLGLGLGPLPALAMPGVAAGQVFASALGSLVLIRYMRSGRAAVTLRLGSVRLERALFADILRVGATAAIAPLQSILTIVLLNRYVAGFGATALAGFGIGTRFEFLLTPLAFAVGVAAVPLVGSAIGAGRIDRARRAAWIGAAVGGSGLAVLGVVLALVPELWAHVFTSDPATIATTALYFGWAGPAYGFFGIGMVLYFASMAAGRVGGMVLAGTLRLVVIAVGGALLVGADAPLWTMFALITLGMACYGLAAVVAVLRTPWGVASTPAPVVAIEAA